MNSRGRSSVGVGTGSFESFEYLPCSENGTSPVWNGYGDPDLTENAAAEAAANGHAEWEKRLAEEARKAFEAGRERGRLDAQDAQREALTNARRHEEQRMAGLAESFSAARDRYLGAVEGEVVKLALAVAARILRREAQMDPLLLTGAVRVALGQLSATTEVTLRVPAGDLELWREAIGHLPNLALKPQVLAGEGLRLGDCAIESRLGTVDLGVRAQLGEIERGFFDRAGSGPDAPLGQRKELPGKELPAVREERE